MSDYRGSFCWYELMSPDTAASLSFYEPVVGWSAAPQPGGDPPYMVLLAGHVGVGGVMQLTPEMTAGGARPTWLGYIGVDDVDLYAERTVKAGGAVHKAPADIPGVGRFAMAADPHGAPFVLFKPSTDGERLPGVTTEPGYVAWRELLADDGPEAFDFYASVFGWTKVEAIDMGPMGVYQLFADRQDGEAVGGMMTRPPHTPTPVWNYYIEVESVDAAMVRLKAAGGTVLNGPHQVPGGKWIVQGADPQGATVCLTSIAA